MIGAMLAGNSAYLVEKSNELTILKSFIKIVQKIYPNKKIQPIEYKLTNWGSEPYIKGSYSYVKTNSNPNLYVDLKKSVGNNLYFCGEHTSRYYPATVHGALMSGIETASDLFNDWIKNNSSKD